MARGEVIPLASVTSVSSVSTIWITTFFAENWVPSEDTCGTSPWKRSHTCLEGLHFQNTSEELENGTWAWSIFSAFFGAFGQYTNRGSGGVGSYRSRPAAYSPLVLV